MLAREMGIIPTSSISKVSKAPGFIPPGAFAVSEGLLQWTTKRDALMFETLAVLVFHSVSSNVMLRRERSAAPNIDHYTSEFDLARS